MGWGVGCVWQQLWYANDSHPSLRCCASGARLVPSWLDWPSHVTGMYNRARSLLFFLLKVQENGSVFSKSKTFRQFVFWNWWNIVSSLVCGSSYYHLYIKFNTSLCSTAFFPPSPSSLLSLFLHFHSLSPRLSFILPLPFLNITKQRRAAATVQLINLFRRIPERKEENTKIFFFFLSFLFFNLLTKRDRDDWGGENSKRKCWCCAAWINGSQVCAGCAAIV